MKFDEIEYLAVNPDVALAVREGPFVSGLEHYEKYGKGEGRTLLTRIITGTLREEKVFHLIDKKGLGLEIGFHFN